MSSISIWIVCAFNFSLCFVCAFQFRRIKNRHSIAIQRCENWMKKQQQQHRAAQNDAIAWLTLYSSSVDAIRYFPFSFTLFLPCSFTVSFPLSSVRGYRPLPRIFCSNTVVRWSMECSVFNWENSQMGHSYFMNGLLHFSPLLNLNSQKSCTKLINNNSSLSTKSSATMLFVIFIFGITRNFVLFDWSWYRIYPRQYLNEARGSGVRAKRIKNFVKNWSGNLRSVTWNEWVHRLRR